MNLFPIIQPRAAVTETALPLYREVQWDYENDVPKFKNGAPVLVEGAEAVLVWAWKALRTPRFKHEIYTWNYGSDAEQLIGRPFTEELKRAEAARCVRECLMINPYIQDVTDINVSFADGRLAVTATIKTIYGEVTVNAA